MTKLLPPGVASERTGLAVSTLAKLRVKGGGPPFKRIGARVMYPENLLEEWLEARPVQHSTADGTVRRPGAGRPPKRAA
jgi:hypothetical protein